MPIVCLRPMDVSGVHLEGHGCIWALRAQPGYARYVKWTTSREASLLSDSARALFLYILARCPTIWRRAIGGCTYHGSAPAPLGGNSVRTFLCVYAGWVKPAGSAKHKYHK